MLFFSHLMPCITLFTEALIAKEFNGKKGTLSPENACF